MRNNPESPLDPKEEAMCEAAYQGDITELRRLIDLGYPLVSEELGSPMDFAAAAGDIVVVKLLHEAGAPVNGRDGDGFPIYWAVANERYTALRRLVELGADINADEHAAIKLAVDMRDLDLIKLVLELGGNIEAALEQAKVNEYPEIESYLWGEINAAAKEERAQHER